MYKKSNLSYKADITHMTPPASVPHIFPIGSYCHTALTPTTHRNKHALQERRADGEVGRLFIIIRVYIGGRTDLEGV